MTETPTPEAPRKRLDELVAPGWANLCANLLRGGGILVGVVLIWLGFLTGGFFLALTGVLGAIAFIGGWLLGGLVQRPSWYESANAKTKSYALAIGFPIALLVFAQVVGPLLTPAPTTTACFNKTFVQTGQGSGFALPIDPRIKSMVFNLQVTDISGGAVRWFMQDPTGQSRWSGREEAAGTFTSAPLSATGGQWMLNVVNEADHATFNLEWRSLDPAPTGQSSTCLTPPV